MPNVLTYERRIAFQQLRPAFTAGRLRFVVRQLLDVLERVPIKPIRAKHSLDESPAPFETLLVA